MKLIDKIFGTYSERELKKIQPIVDKIAKLETEYTQYKTEYKHFNENLSQDELTESPPAILL